MKDGSFTPQHIQHMDLPPELLDKYCVCYLKHCVAGVKNIAGYFGGIRVQKDQLFFHFEAEDGHDFFVPIDNIAYFQALSDEALKKLEEQNKKQLEESQKKEESNIKNQIQSTMNKIQEQLENADQSESAGNSQAEENGDSDFVFKL